MVRKRTKNIFNKKLIKIINQKNHINIKLYQKKLINFKMIYLRCWKKMEKLIVKLLQMCLIKRGNLLITIITLVTPSTPTK